MSAFVKSLNGRFQGKRIAMAVDALVALLAQIDGDADRGEDNPPEDDAPAEDVGDNEPSLGSAGSTALAGPIARSAGRRALTTTG
jgi:hypothetical protein